MILSLIVTRQCNFSCKCCPVIRSELPCFEWTQEDTEIICQFVIDSGVSSISFTGGEPTLVIETIETIQAALPAEINFSLTTNGSFLESLECNLSRISLNQITVSIDKYHDEFSSLSLDAIRSGLETASTLGVQPGIAIIVDDHRDFELLASFQDSDIPIHPIRRMSFPEIIADDIFAKSEFSQTELKCPNCGPQGDDIVFYFPGHGFCRCSGRMLFENHSCSNIFFADSYKSLKSHTFWNQVLNENFEQFLDRHRVDNLANKYDTACDLCTFLNSRKFDKNGNSLADYLDAITKRKHIPAVETIAEPVAAVIRQTHRIRYGYVGNANSFPDGLESGIDYLGISEVDLNSIDADYYMNQCDFSFDRNRAAGFSEMEIMNWKRALRQAITGQFSPIKGRVFMLGQTIVSSVMVSEDIWSVVSDSELGLYIGDFGSFRVDLLNREQIDAIFNRAIYWLKTWASNYGGRIGTMVIESDGQLRSTLESWEMKIAQAIFNERL